MPEIALVHDALPFWGGAEQVLASMLNVFPTAPVFTLLYNRARFCGTVLETHDIRTSFIDRLPGVYANHYRYTPLFPQAIERLNVQGYPVVLSLNYAVAHGVVTSPEQVHIGYTFTPLRYVWQNNVEYLSRLRGPKKLLARWLLDDLRAWDVRAAARVDCFVAISHWVARLIEWAYGRSAEVIYPPVEVERFAPLTPREDYYIVVSRMAPHKKVPVIVEAFARLGKPLIVVGTGDEWDQVAARAHCAPNVQLLGWQPPEKLPELLGRARAFVHLGEDDFGIALVEAQAAGCPVIALGRGGARETVVPGKTGVLFDDQSVEGIMRAVEMFEDAARFDEREICDNAARFSRERFEREMGDLVEQTYTHHKKHGSGKNGRSVSPQAIG
ncbi:MAG TPA: glycosyltransferase [Anaerolineales bacterium]|nr:glycosyltransferase [Anaerolineales bacterium]